MADKHEVAGSGDIGEIADLCGTDVVLKLCRRFGGGRLYIPKLNSLSRELRDKAIRREFLLEDATVGELARKYGLSRRRVFDILKVEE